VSLEGKVALVTGSSRGIGRAIALKLTQLGAEVIVHGRTPSPQLDSIAEEIEALGQPCLKLSGDLRREVQVDGLIKKVASHHPQVHILVNNAAMGSFGPAIELSERQIQGTLDATFTGLWRLTKGVVRSMNSGWGRVINVSSLGAQRYLPGYAAVGAAKAAVESLTRSLAVELAPRGIIVNAVAGGMTYTDSAAKFPNEIKIMREAYLKHSPAGRLASPDDLAGVVALLCRDEAGWIVGQTIVADGGFSLI